MLSGLLCNSARFEPWIEKPLLLPSMFPNEGRYCRYAITNPN
jgi:hypothetical protein